MKKGKIIFVLILVLAYLLLLSTFTVLLLSYNKDQPLFFNLATALLLSWVVTVVMFYIWAIYYYHIQVPENNKHIELQQSSGYESKHLSTQDTHYGETMSLPKGTIRGTIALSLLVAGLCLLIASLDMSKTYEANKLFVDNFEFIKTAFLMVIAFYFGHKSLTAINEGNRGIYRPNNQSVDSSNHEYKGYDNQQQNDYAATNDTNRKDDHPVLIPNTDAREVKQLLKSHDSIETIDDGDRSDFDDHDAQG